MTFEWQFRSMGGRELTEQGSDGVIECWSVGLRSRGVAEYVLVLVLVLVLENRFAQHL